MHFLEGSGFISLQIYWSNCISTKYKEMWFLLFKHGSITCYHRLHYRVGKRFILSCLLRVTENLKKKLHHSVAREKCNCNTVAAIHHTCETIIIYMHCKGSSYWYVLINITIPDPRHKHFTCACTSTVLVAGSVSSARERGTTKTSNIPFCVAPKKGHVWSCRLHNDSLYRTCARSKQKFSDV